MYVHGSAKILCRAIFNTLWLINHWLICVTLHPNNPNNPNKVSLSFDYWIKNSETIDELFDRIGSQGACMTQLFSIKSDCPLIRGFSFPGWVVAFQGSLCSVIPLLSTAGELPLQLSGLDSLPCGCVCTAALPAPRLPASLLQLPLCADPTLEN